MNLKDIGTCGGLVTVHFSLLCVAIMNLLAAMVFCADSALHFLPLLTTGDLFNHLLLTGEETPRCFVVFPQMIFLSFSLVLLIGAVKHQAQCLYAYLIYGISRITITVFTSFMLAGNYYDTADFYDAITSHYMGTLVGSFFYNSYTLLLVRWSIMDIASKCKDQKVKVISGFKMDEYPLEQKPPKELFIGDTI